MPHVSIRMCVCVSFQLSCLLAMIEVQLSVAQWARFRKGPAAGSSECPLCQPGRFSTGVAAECTQCPPGTYREAAGGVGIFECKLCLSAGQQLDIEVIKL